MLLLWRTKPLGEALSKEGNSAVASSQPPARQGAPQQAPGGHGQAYNYGKVNHLDAEAIQDAQDVAIDMFPVESHPAKVLFDTGATHSFVSTSWVEAHNILIESMIPPFKVNSVGGKLKFSLIGFVRI
jgi:hypothetical protein